MLQKPDGDLTFKCRCEKCGKVADTDETTFEDALDVMLKTSWLEMPIKGKDRARYPWRCPECRPKPAGNLGPSTPPMPSGDPPPSSE